MSIYWRTELSHSLKPSTILASVTAGLVAGVLAVTFMFSYSAVIFTGDLASYVPRATGQMLFGAVVISLVVGLFSQFRGVVALPQDNPTAIIAVMIAALSQTLGSDANPETLFLKATIVMILSSIVGGLIFFAIGHWKLTSLVQYVPYPVIAGFLAGTGWLLFKGSFSVMAGVAFDFGDIASLVSVANLWLPGAVFALVVLVISQRFTHAMVMPALIIGAVGLFHLLLFLTDTTLLTAISDGWLLEPFGAGGLWQPVGLDVIANFDWGTIFGDLSGIVTILVIALISVLLNLTALESAFGQDIDINVEMRTAGIANLLAAPGGGLIGYHYVSLSTLGRHMKGDSRLVGVVVAAFCLVAMTVGANALSYFPRFVLGGLVMFIGLGFLKDWVLESWTKLSRSDFAIIIAILIVIETVGFLEGVAAGIMITVVLFVINYSRVNVVRYVLTGKEIQSNIERPREQRSVLAHEGDRVLYLKLQGFIFFATSNDLFAKFEEAIIQSGSRVSFVILDFQYVSGIDTSAIHGFVKIKQKALEAGIQLALTHVSPEIDALFRAEKFADGDAVIDPVFNDADHALEWCEDFILRDSGYNPRFGFQSLSGQLESIFETQKSREKFLSYLDPLEFSAGEYLYRVHDHERRIFLIEHGVLSIFFEEDNGQQYRIRRVGSGSLAGIVEFFRNTKADSSDSIRADTDGKAFALSEKSFDRMKIEEPALAIAFQEHVLAFMSDRFAESQRALEVAVRTEN